ncbi:hypothetical protein ATANTOWER_003127 [Ataeniobius toweri]|uniref:Cilia and flagella associated protein 298 n=1 Tax=Ataeniobius toweri TaxID=208326 RepID=A0ABU7B2F3_9TELE|nr:hypothetical protein [Ataeniobius toweri]
MSFELLRLCQATQFDSAAKQSYASFCLTGGELQVTAIYNGRLKVDRICSEIPELADHGVTLPPNMQGLTEEQIVELKLKDEWEERCIPSGGEVFRKDEIGRRNGHAPNDKMKDVLMRTVEEAKALICKKQVQANVCVTMEMVKEALDQLRGAVMIVYPMGLPPHDPIRMEFEEQEDLSGTQASLQVIAEDECQLWWAGKEMQRGKKLQDYIGKNEKTKLVVKIQKVEILGKMYLFIYLSMVFLLNCLLIDFRKDRGRQRESPWSLMSSINR